MQCHLTKHTLFDRIRFVCSKDMVTQQPSSGELRLCELSQEPQICELKEARRGAPKLRHGVRCSSLDYCKHISDVQHIIDQPYNAILLLTAEVHARQVIYRCCMYICSRGPANPGHLCVCGVACSVQLSSGYCVKVLGSAVRGKQGGGGVCWGGLLPLPSDITFVLSMPHPAGRNAHWLCSCHLTTGSLGKVHSSGIHLIAMLPTFCSAATQTLQVSLQYSQLQTCQNSCLTMHRCVQG